MDLSKPWIALWILSVTKHKIVCMCTKCRYKLSNYYAFLSIVNSNGSLSRNICCHEQEYLHFCKYSRTSDNRPSEKRKTSLQTHSVLRIEITIVITLKQPPRSGRFLIPDSGQDLNSQRRFSIQSCL